MPPSRMGRARPRLNGDEGRVRSDKTTSVSHVIYRMAEATMFWMIRAKGCLLLIDRKSPQAICYLNLCVAQHHLPDRATSFGASHHHLCAAQHHCTAGAYRGGVAVISRLRSRHILGKAIAALDLLHRFHIVKNLSIFGLISSLCLLTLSPKNVTIY